MEEAGSLPLVLQLVSGWMGRPGVGGGGALAFSKLGETPGCSPRLGAADPEAGEGRSHHSHAVLRGALREPPRGLAVLSDAPCSVRLPPLDTPVTERWPRPAWFARPHGTQLPMERVLQERMSSPAVGTAIQRPLWRLRFPESTSPAGPDQPAGLSPRPGTAVPPGRQRPPLPGGAGPCSPGHAQARSPVLHLHLHLRVLRIGR